VQPPNLGCNFVSLDETERSFRRHPVEAVSNAGVAWRLGGRPESAALSELLKHR
jgi:hypothetical protein